MSSSFVTQPRYLPSIDYLFRIAAADTFVVLDNVQRTARGWENRNQVTNLEMNRPWITIPILSGKYERISNTTMQAQWQKHHRNLWHEWYRDTKYYDPILLNEYYASFGGTRYFLEAMLRSYQFLIDRYSLNTRIVTESSLLLNKPKGADLILDATESVGCNAAIVGRFSFEYGLTQAKANERNIELFP
jgi:hypothetical protein